jgi:tetratricopeptide (TPR) repeat protein
VTRWEIANRETRKMGKSQSRMEEARKELADLETKGDLQKLEAKLKQFVKVCLSQGALEEVINCLNRLLSIQEHASQTKLEIANTMYLLGNSLRLQLQSVPDPGKPSAFPDEKERTRAYARAEDLLHRALETRISALKTEPDSKDVKMAVARTKSALAMIQSAYGGRREDAQAQHEGALEIFAEFPLTSDPEGWIFSKGAWTSKKLGVLNQHVAPASIFVAKPTLVTEDSSFRVDSDQTRYNRAATTNTHAVHQDGEDGSLTDEEAPVSSSKKKSTKWRLVIRYPKVSERRPSAIERLKRIGSFNAVAINDAFDGIVQKIDLEAGMKVEVGLPIPDTKRNQLESQGITYVALGPKEKLSKVVCERHCCFEEITATEDSHPRWIVTDFRASSSKTKGILVNGVRVNRAPVRAGDVIQLGNCSKIRMGSSSSLSKIPSIKDPFANGIEFLCERVITTIDDTDVSAVAPSALFETSDTTDTAFKHFHLLAVGAQMNLNAPTLNMDQTSDLFAAAVKSGVPFNLWDSWIYAELSKRRLVS